MLVYNSNSRVVNEPTRPMREVIKAAYCAVLIETMIWGSAVIVALLIAAFVG